MQKIFENADTIEKLYILGYNAGDYALGREQTGEGVDIAVLFNDDVLNISSDAIADSIAAIRQDDSAMPSFTNEVMFWTFLRGFFDAAGEITDTKEGYLRCQVTIPDVMWHRLVGHITMPYHTDHDVRIWDDNNALDFLDKLYKESNTQLRNKTNYSKYLSWCNFIPSINNGCEAALHANWAKILPNAFAPHKERATDSGYDLHLVSIWKKQGVVTFYDTGIAVSPDFGWYFTLVARSSLSKSGYILANSVGIIDRTYTGSIKVPLIKIDPDAPDIELPFRAVQIIPTPIVHAQMHQVKKEELSTTNRGDGGFGSTNK
jgi:deoxyuridine 5'-triphosphate nucleotidohydrolase